MKFIKNIVLAVMTVAMLTVALPMSAYAQTTEANQPAPCAEHITEADVYLIFDGNTADCTTMVSVDSTIEIISITMNLQKYWGLWIWNNVTDGSWLKNSYASSTTFNRTFDVTESGNYRVESVIIVKDADGNRETITVYSEEILVTV